MPLTNGNRKIIKRAGRCPNQMASRSSDDKINIIAAKMTKPVSKKSFFIASGAGNNKPEPC